MSLPDRRAMISTGHDRSGQERSFRSDLSVRRQCELLALARSGANSDASRPGIPILYCGPVLRHPTALIQAAKDSSPTFALATRS
jgi:hypothetical protein